MNLERLGRRHPATPHVRSDGQSGTAMVEVVVVLSLVFLPLIWALITFGYAFSVKENMTHSAQEALRHAVLTGQSPTTTNAALACTAITDARSRMVGIVGSHAQASVTDSCSTAQAGGGLDITTNYVPGGSPDVFPACTNSSGSGTIAGSQCITVVLVYQYAKYPIVTPLPGIFNAIPSTMRVVATQRLS